MSASDRERVASERHVEFFVDRGVWRCMVSKIRQHGGWYWSIVGMIFDGVCVGKIFLGVTECRSVFV